MALTSFPLLLKLPTETLNEIVSLQKIPELVQISRTSNLCHTLATRHLYACVSLLIDEQLERFVNSNSSGPRPYEHLEHIKTFSLELDFSPPLRPAYLTAIGWMISSRMINLRKLQLERPEKMLPLITLLRTVHLPRLQSLSMYFCPTSAPHIEPFIALHPALNSLTLRLDSLHLGYDPNLQPFAQLHLPELQYYDGTAHLLPVLHAPSLRVMHLGWHGPGCPSNFGPSGSYGPYGQVVLDADRSPGHLTAIKELKWSPGEQEEDDLIISIWEGLRCLRFVHFNGFQWMRDNKNAKHPLVRFIHN
ncbi:hypothetical protein B0H16DRAFT_1476967 [Mycena metata]|uniref:F-box domain-containing protein n=1 Tax=Mycena metata TaxID=1033252 RepID=A0AAD7HAL3_9AGAR|nr:hypothetical protein B0H16DRAFT_1476967 [Mycena metata]